MYILYWFLPRGFSELMLHYKHDGWKSQLAGGRPVGYLHSAAEELNSGRPKSNPVSGRAEDLNPGPPDYKSSALSTRSSRLIESLSFLGMEF